MLIKPSISSLFFVKSHRIDKLRGINAYLFSSLIDRGERFLWDHKGIVRTNLQFWREFYSHLPPEVIDRVSKSYSFTNNGLIDVSIIYGGRGLCENILEIVGPTKYEENFTQKNFPLKTIRAIWGDPNKLENTAVHASDPGKVTREIEVFNKFTSLIIDI